MDEMMRPRANLWPHLTNHERACLMDWWVELETLANGD